MRMHADHVNSKHSVWGRVIGRELWRIEDGVWDGEVLFERGVAVSFTAKTWIDGIRCAELVSCHRFRDLSEVATGWVARAE